MPRYDVYDHREEIINRISISTLTHLRINAVDPSIAISPNPLLITESRAMMNYYALRATLRQRLTDGLEYTVNYTYSKSMTNRLGNYALNVDGYSGAFQNYYNSAADYGPAGYDATHNLSFTSVYAFLERGHVRLQGIPNLQGAGLRVPDGMRKWNPSS